VRFVLVIFRFSMLLSWRSEMLEAKVNASLRSATLRSSQRTSIFINHRKHLFASTKENT